MCYNDNIIKKEVGKLSYKWYPGVPHIHTVASDGKYTVEELIKKAKKNKIEYLIITDHNTNCKEELPKVNGLTLIYGAELTKHGGHTNLWGVKDVVDDYSKCETYEDWKAIKNEAKRRGAIVCMNHPLCSQCPWRWEKDVSEIDVLEIWNSPMHYDNLVCTDWWMDLLREGHKLPVVGGSDYHRDYVVTNLIGNPVTYVYAKSDSPEDILEGIVKGRTTISNGVGKTFINITYGCAMLGDTVSVQNGVKAKVSVKRMKRNHTLHVFNQDGECFTFKAEKAGDYSFEIAAPEKGFLCAYVTYDISPAYELVYNVVIGSKIPEQKGMKMPPFIYAQSGAIYFE